MTTSTQTPVGPPRVFRLSAETSELLKRFPPRPVAERWEATCQDRRAVLRRLLAPPFRLDHAGSQEKRKYGLIRVLDWLQAQPGETWQQRWIASGAGVDGRTDWRGLILQWLIGTGRIAPTNRTARETLGTGLLQLLGGDVIRPDMAWLVASTSPKNLAVEMARVRDPGGFAELTKAAQAATTGAVATNSARIKVAIILAAKGGTVRDITVGDALQLVQLGAEEGRSAYGKSPYFYQLLHAMGVFPAAAPSTIRMFSPKHQGQPTVEQLIDRYELTCRPIRGLFVEYLRERQPGIDFRTLQGIATNLGLSFWKDLENHHPGICSLRLAPDVAAAWKQRVQTRPSRSKSPDGDGGQATLPRRQAYQCLNTVRAFYLDIAQWAMDDPARWGPWAVPCPIRADDVQTRKARGQRKSRMDQRTRERIPVLPVLLAHLERRLTEAAEFLEAARNASPGKEFTAAGHRLRRRALTIHSPRVWVEDLDSGKRRDLTREEDHAFWTWAAVEVLRETGIRIEELGELSHHSLVQYKLPTTGQTIPLLQIAPSKTDEERLLVVSPELAEVLSTILSRIRNADSAVPLVVAYDSHERRWNPPMPLLFQHRVGMEDQPVATSTIRNLIKTALRGTDLTDAAGKPLTFVPHDFRRIFVTDAVLNGMPPHIAQLLCGHRDINTTMGYKAVYPEDVISNHRAFIARRRALRPAEEYRTPTDAEWEEFLGHFERRRVALGDCGRAYATGCIHEHACVRCPLLRPDPAQRPRIVQIRDNLTDRISEAEREGWLGEVEGLKVSLAAAEQKLAQLDGLAARRQASIDLGMPAFPDVAGRTVTANLTPRAERT